MTGVVAALELAELGLFRDAAEKIDETPSVSQDLSVLRARLELDVGTPTSAHQLATQLLTQTLSPSGRSCCWEIVARTELNTGEIDRGLKAMYQAFLAAELSRDSRLKARLIASNCDALLHWVGIESAAAELPRLRRAAIASGDPFSLIAFHYLVAELKAKKGLLSAAKHSAETALALLQRWPNVWQQGRLATTRSGIHIIESDWESALSASMEALDCAEQSGSRRVRIPALGNLAHIKLAQGEFAEASRIVNELLAIVQRGGNTEIAGLDTRIQIALAQHNLELCRDLIRDALKTSSALEGGSSYSGTWLMLTRIKWLFKIGDVSSGLELALSAISQVQRLGDRNLLVRMKLLAAEGLARSGRTVEGASALAEAINFDNPSIEIHAEAMRVMGRVTASGDSLGASGHFQRAANIFEAVGNTTALKEVTDDAQETLGISICRPEANSEPIDRVNAGRTAPRDQANTLVGTYCSALTDRIAALLHPATVPPLLAKELLLLMADAGIVLQAAVVVVNRRGQRQLVSTYPNRDERSDASDNPKAVRIMLGTHRELDYEVCAIPRAAPSARVTLIAIKRLAQSALALTRGRELEREQATPWSESTPESQLGLICSSDRMLELIKTVRQVADSKVTVLLCGETGVGKELFARALHQTSSRSDKTFLPFNCTTVPRDMFDSQLFGHRRGSFTGAHEDSLGVIRTAAGGTLFLDEIGELALDVQPKLLRFLESGEVQPLGDPKPKLVDVRVVAATNANLDQLVSDGRFREDLFYRLNVIRINIPPLRERREEIPALVEHFLERHGRELQKPMLRVADETLEYLVLYRWPGNVRQLANEIRRMVAFAEPNSVLMPAHLSDDIVASRRTIPAGQLPRGFSEVIARIDQPLAAAVEHVERAAIQRALAMTNGHLDEAARMLGLSRKGLYLKRQRLNLG